MRGAARRGRRVTDAVSPSGTVRIVKLKNGSEVWYVEKPDGEPDEESIGVIRPGEHGWGVIERVIRLAYGTDDVESWARSVIGRSLACSDGGAASSETHEMPAPRDSRARAPMAVAPVLALIRA